MIADEGGYSGTGKFRLKRDQGGKLENHALPLNDLQRPTHTYHLDNLWREKLNPIQNHEQSFKLQYSSAEYVWNAQENTKVEPNKVQAPSTSTEYITHNDAAAICSHPPGSSQVIIILRFNM